MACGTVDPGANCPDSRAPSHHWNKAGGRVFTSTSAFSDLPTNHPLVSVRPLNLGTSHVTAVLLTDYVSCFGALRKGAGSAWKRNTGAEGGG
jgi:hypothetical protein